MPNPYRIGLDLDGVIIDHRSHKCKLAGEFGFSIEPWQTNANVMKRYVTGDAYESLKEQLYTRFTPDAPPVAGALERLAEITAELYIVSARRPHTVRYAQQWLVKHRIYDAVPAERIFFCGSDNDKRSYCDRLGIDIYLDDKVNVLENLSGRVKRVLFDEDGVAERLQLSDWLRIAKTWEEFAAIVNER